MSLPSVTVENVGQNYKKRAKVKYEKKKKKKKNPTSLSLKSEKYQLMLLKKDCSFFSKFSINLASQSSSPQRLILMSKMSVKWLFFNLFFFLSKSFYGTSIVIKPWSKIYLPTYLPACLPAYLSIYIIYIYIQAFTTRALISFLIIKPAIFIVCMYWFSAVYMYSILAFNTFYI